MIRKEINEIKSQYTLEECSILKMAGCYVDGEKNKVTKIDETFLNLPDEEKHKYFEIFKKTLSGTSGKNLIDMKFSSDSYDMDGARTFLFKLRDSELKDENLLNEFYDKIISSYYYAGNYLILLIHQVYDVPGKTKDGIKMEDASENVYNYLLCSICHVSLSKPGLGYNEVENAFHNQIQNHMVDAPDIGFLFPAFNDRSEDGDSILYYSKDADDFQQEFLLSVLNCDAPLPASNQKETFHNIITETLGEDCDYETVKNIHNNLNNIIDQNKGALQPVELDKTQVKDLLEKSGVKEEHLEKFESTFEDKAGENTKLLASNLVSTRKFEVKTPDVVVKISPDKTGLIETRVIDGKRCLVIEIDERLEVNGVIVNPNTGEVIETNY